MSKKRVLAAIVGEKFYAVHSKAQKRVPVPEGLDLEKPFSSSALSKLMAIEIPENLSLATLLLTNIPTPVYPERRDDERVGHFAKSSFSNEDYNKLLSRGLDIIHNHKPEILGKVVKSHGSCNITEVYTQTFSPGYYNETKIDINDINAILVWRTGFDIR
jgi:hypothetical protein